MILITYEGKIKSYGHWWMATTMRTGLPSLHDHNNPPMVGYFHAHIAIDHNNICVLLAFRHILYGQQNFHLFSNLHRTGFHTTPHIETAIPLPVTSIAVMRDKRDEPDCLSLFDDHLDTEALQALDDDD